MHINTFGGWTAFCVSVGAGALITVPEYQFLAVPIAIGSAAVWLAIFTAFVAKNLQHLRDWISRMEPIHIMAVGLVIAAGGVGWQLYRGPKIIAGPAPPPTIVYHPPTPEQIAEAAKLLPQTVVHDSPAAPPAPPPMPVYLADVFVGDAEPPVKFPATGTALVLKGRINEDINGKVEVFVDYGQNRVPLGEISGTRNEKRELRLIEIVALNNDPRSRELFWGDPEKRRPFPTEPTPVQLHAICIVLKGDKGDQQLPFVLIRIKNPYGGWDILNRGVPRDSTCKR